MIPRIHRQAVSLASRRPSSSQARNIVSHSVSVSKEYFPPVESKSAAIKEKPFNPFVWRSLQPPPASALAAFASRLRLFERKGTSSSTTVPAGTPASLPADYVKLLTKALTHPSFLPLHSEHRPNEAPPETNKDLNELGDALLGLFATEFVHVMYPHLPTPALMAAVTAYVGPQTCTDLAHEWGLANLVRWRRVPEGSEDVAPVLHSDAFASVARSIVALKFQYHSLPEARDFVRRFFFSRHVDLRQFVKFSNPIKALRDTAELFNREPPVSRLERETGAKSHSPVFVVGVYSGADKLGEGFGSSLAMAEFRAAEDALQRLYLTRTPTNKMSLPSSTFGTGPTSGESSKPSTKSVAQTTNDSFLGLLSPMANVYRPQEIGQVEVLFRNGLSLSAQGAVHKKKKLEVQAAKMASVLPTEKDGKAPAVTIHPHWQ